MPNTNTAPVMEEYVLITVAKQNFTWEGRVLSRGLPYLQVRVSLPIRMKNTVRVQVSDVCLVNMHDADSGVGTADIIEVLEPKEVRKLRHKKMIPEEEEYAYLMVSDKKLGYTGGAFPYKAKISGMGASTMPEDPDVIARARAEAKAARRAARKAANNGVSPAMSASTTPATSPSLAPTGAPDADGLDGALGGMTLEGASPADAAGSAPQSPPTTTTALSPMAPLPSATNVSSASGAPAEAVSPSDDDAEESEEEEDQHHASEDEEKEEEAVDEEAVDENDLDNIVNPNHAKWVEHDGGVSKGYVSKRERRDLAMEQRLKKRAEPAPRQSPSLIPQIAALDRVGGDAELEAI